MWFITSIFLYNNTYEFQSNGEREIEKKEKQKRHFPLCKLNSSTRNQEHFFFEKEIKIKKNKCSLFR